MTDVPVWPNADESLARPRDRLVTFLYLLLRDTLPAGEVARLFHESAHEKQWRTKKLVGVESKPVEVVTFSNKHLEAYARELAAELSK